MTKVLARYRLRRCPADLAEAKRSGRPRVASEQLAAEQLLALLRTDPRTLGYAATGWTAPLLAAHLRRSGMGPLSVWTLRRRLHAADFAWKRPRYAFAQKEPHRAQKKGPLRAS